MLAFPTDLSPVALTLTHPLLLAGLMIGCMNAWYWVAKEDRAMRDDRGEMDRDQHDA